MITSTPYAPPDGPLDILHHDAQLVVVNKPAGLLSVPGKGEHLADCLIERIRAVFPEDLARNDTFRAELTHALTTLTERGARAAIEEYLS